MNFGIIYSLNCPFTGVVKYIGKTKRPLSQRLAGHMHDKRITPKYAWIISLLKKGAKPTIHKIDEVEILELNFWERYYIELYVAAGVKLKNSTLGGEGLLISETTRQKMRKAKLGKKQTAEHIANRIKGRSGYKHGQETKNKIGAKNKGHTTRFAYKHSQETKNKIGAKNKGRKVSDYQKEISRKIHLGKKLRRQSIVKRTETRLANGWNKRTR